MTGDKRANAVIGLCLLAVALALGGLFFVVGGQHDILSAVAGLPDRPPLIATHSYTYTDVDGEPHTVTVSGDASDPLGLALRFREQVNLIQKEFIPRR